jgi:hypothetical protein
MERQVSNIILGISGPAESFKLKYGLFRFHLSIKPLSARQIVDISGHASKINDIDLEINLFSELLKNSQDLWHISRIIAIATGTRYKILVSKAIMGLALKDILTLFTIVRRQSDPEQFFFIMALMKGLNKLKTQKEQ